MLKTLLGAFVGARVQERSGHPLTGAVVGAAAVSLARRSLPSPSAWRWASLPWSWCRATARGARPSPRLGARALPGSSEPGSALGVFIRPLTNLARFRKGQGSQ